MDCTTFMQDLVARNPGETEFHQAVHELVESVAPWINEHPEYEEARILERMVEPDRVVSFRVAWEDDRGRVQVNRGYRVQFNRSIGPYKGGLRFDPSVSQGILKFLAFEQTFKNSLTTLPLGSGKGGADFDPKNRSDREVMRFSQSFMSELQRHIGAETDVPAGDIGVGAREIGYLFGQYQRLSNEFTGALTGKGLEFGGSPIRTEATGFGVVYFARQVLASLDEDLEGRACALSGSGNVAQHAAQKLVELGAKVMTLSDRGGFIHCSDGLTWEQVEHLIDLKTRRRASLEVGAAEIGCTYVPGELPWGVPCDLAFPCATQNEIDGEQARRLIVNGCRLVCEGANMPCTPEATALLQEAEILIAPAKAANAGGVAVSGLEMSQNALRYTLTPEEIDQELQSIMARIHARCVEYGSENGRTDYVKGANLAGFVKVARAMLAQGIV